MRRTHEYVNALVEERVMQAFTAKAPLHYVLQTQLFKIGVGIFKETVWNVGVQIRLFTAPDLPEKIRFAENEGCMQRDGNFRKVYALKTFAS